MWFVKGDIFFIFSVKMWYHRFSGSRGTSIIYVNSHCYLVATLKV